MKLTTLLLLAAIAPLLMTNSVDAQTTRPAQTQPAAHAPRLPEGVKMLPDIEYGRVGETSLKLDLYLSTADAAVSLPVIVYIHGGGWSSGSKVHNRATRFAAEGYAVASIDYRLSGQAKFPAQIEDCKAAIRFLRANADKYNLNPDRIGAWGHSAGGHLAALLGTTGDVKELEGAGGNLDQSSRVQAVAVWSGPADFLKFYEDAVADGNRPGRGAIEGLFGGPVLQHRDLAILASPVTHTSQDDPPFLVMHGEADPIVPVNQGKALHEALLKAGAQSTWHSYPGAEHSFDKEKGAYEMVEVFFDQHLKGINAANPGDSTK